MESENRMCIGSLLPLRQNLVGAIQFGRAANLNEICCAVVCRIVCIVDKIPKSTKNNSTGYWIFNEVSDHQHRQFHCVLVFCQMPLYPSDCKIRSTIAWLYWYDDERPKDATASFLNKKSEESGSKHRTFSSQRIATSVSSSSLANSRCGCNYCFTASNAATDIRHCPRT